MTDPGLFMPLLCIAVACFLAVTLTIVVTAAQLRGTLRRLDALLPDAGEALRDLRRSGRQVRQILTRANLATRSVEGVVLRTCQVASDALERVARITDSAQQFWTARFGHGTGAEPRPHHRNGTHHRRRVVE